MGRLYGRLPRKNNKAANAQKKAWIERKKNSIAKINKQPRIFDTFDDDQFNFDHMQTDSVENEINCEDQNQLENDANDYPTNWAYKKYEAQDFFKKRKHAASLTGIVVDELEPINSLPFTIEKDNVVPITGNRIVDLSFVIETVLSVQYKHFKICDGKIIIAKEIKKHLVSAITLNCIKCHTSFDFKTENPMKNPSVINTGAVWGTLATGSTYNHFNELMSCIDIPCMSDKTFYNLENELGTEWRSSLWKSMTDAGKRERELAISKGQLCLDGTPYITVYVGGSWSRRSYGTNFNSLSGMVGIIGRNTGQLLFAAVRNKFCCICEKAKNKEISPKSHQCYKNWDKSAPAMESDMVVEGFNLSESMHGIRYIKYVGDGDSSVYSKLKQYVSYGHEIKKIECTNHALKNYGKHLYKIKTDKTIDLKGRKLLTKLIIENLKKRAKCSIYEHSKTKEKNIALLKEDLQNGLHHIFGDHSKCRHNICNTVGDQNESKILELKSTSIYNHLYGALNLLTRKAHLLIENDNNNRAERLMNIVSRFNMGKRLNLIQRGSYQRRVFLSGLRYNKSFLWHSSPWKKFTGRSPGKYFKKFIATHLKDRSQKSRVCKKLFQPTVHETNDTNTDYGPNAQEPELEQELLDDECKRLIEKLQVNIEERNIIQNNTVGQFENDLYESERQFRLTASLFGRIISRRPQTPCHNIVKACLVNSSFYSVATEYGLAKESVAIKLFEEQSKLVVKKSGLWIDLEYGFLGASPDGLMGDDAIVEVKCIYLKPEIVAKELTDVLKIKKNQICLKKTENGFQLKRNHHYYYQIQGQLNIAQKSKCYFILYVNDNINLYVEEIQKNEKLWREKMLPKLIQFYKECIAPEVIRNNIKKGKRCIDPTFIKEAIQSHSKKIKKNT